MSMPAAVQQTAAQRSAEPSMEEILASIRKIIAEDQKALEAKVAGSILTAPLEAAPAVNDDVEEAALPVVEIDFPPVEDVMPEPTPAIAAPVPALETASRAVAATTPAYEPVVQEPPRLISNETAHQASAAFHTLANTVFTQQARTMDDLVTDMLRPMLTAWLDDHLPALVERLVKAEIERVARGGR